VLALVLSLWSRAREVSIQYLYLVTCHLPEWDGTKNSEKNPIASAQVYSGPEKQKSGPPTLSVKNFTFSFNLNTADGATTFSITTPSIMTPRITIKKRDILHNGTLYCWASFMQCCYDEFHLCWVSQTSQYEECRYAECHYAECHYAECSYTECRGTLHKPGTWGQCYKTFWILNLWMFVIS